MKINLKIFLIPLFLFTFFLFARSNTFAAPQKVWQGANNTTGEWSKTVNWVGGVVPVNGDDVIFPDPATSTVHNQNPIDDIPNLSINSITINGSYTINKTGSTSLQTPLITVNGGAHFWVDNTTNTLTINKSGSGDFNLTSVVGSGSGNPLSVIYNVNAGRFIDNSTFNSNPSTTTFTKNGAGSIFFYGLKNNTGGTYLKGGDVYAYNTSSLGLGNVYMGDTNNLDTNLDIRYSPFANNLFVRPTSAGKLNHFIYYLQPDLAFTGSITSDLGSSTLEIDQSGPGLFTITGNINDQNPSNKLSIIKHFAGKLIYKNSTNNYSGTTKIINGILELDNASATSTTFDQSVGSYELILANNSTIKGYDAKLLTIGDENIPNSYNNSITGDLNIIGTYRIKFTGLNNGEFSRLSVNGNVTLGANSSINDITDENLTLNPTLGQSYTIIQATGTISGNFAGQPNNSLYKLAGKYYKVVYSTNAVTLTNVEAPVVVYRFENKLSGLHHFTISQSEADYLQNSDYGKANWNYEGPKFRASTTQEGGLQPVYRFFNIYNGQHFLTMSENEADFLRNSDYGKANWQDEGISFYASSTYIKSTLPVYRLAHNFNGEHFYTINFDEFLFLVSSDYGKTTWTYEGTGFYTYTY